MTSRHGTLTVQLGGRYAIGLFILSLLAFVVETQLTQYVQTNLGFRRPYFLFYVVHSAFAVMLPLHFAFLMVSSKESPRALWAGLMVALKEHLYPHESLTATSASRIATHPFRTRRFALLLGLLTIGATAPGLLWFCAVTLAPLTDVTALWNTNAFFAYLLTVKLYGLKWDLRRLGAVILATVGAAVVVYGGSRTPELAEPSPEIKSSARAIEIPKSAFIGDLLTLFASIIYGVYQVLYKRYATLPNDPEVLAEGDGLYSRVPSESVYSEIASPGDELTEETILAEASVAHPPPFGLFPNLLTSAIGVATFLFLWIPLPILHFSGIMPFELPTSPLTIATMAGIALSGVVFNGGFMILLGVWGPIVTSVGSLLTIVLVFLSDFIFGGAVETITVWALLGSVSIVVAFGILAYDMVKGH